MGDADIRLWQIEWKMRNAKSSFELLSLMDKYKGTLTPSIWAAIFRSKYFSQKIYKDFESLIPWEHIALFQEVPEEYIERYIDRFDYYEISCFYPLSAGFIKKHYHLLSLDRLANNEKLEKGAHDLAVRLYAKFKDSPEFHKRWDTNLRESTAFCPRNFRGRYGDYTVETPYPEYKPLSLKKKEPKKQNIIQTTPAQPKKRTPKPEDYLGKTKAELKAILTKRNVRVYYHDTLDILRAKCAESEGK